MTDRPILFSAPMVRAMLDGRKTQTRRVLRAPAPFDPSDDISAEVASGFVEPGFRSGDRLWVREGFVTGFDIDEKFGRPSGDRKVWYRASDAGLRWYDPDTESTLDNPPWKPSIHMPRWASRLTLTVTEVRVQRLQDICEDDAAAEGCPAQTDDELAGMEVRGWFHDLWDSLNADRAPWASNPWVVALTFTVRRGNIDQLGAAT